MWSRVTATGALVLALAAAGPVGIAAADPPAPPPQPKTTIDHDGTFTVGTDIVAGTYSSAGPLENGTCYWKRVSTSGDTLDNAMTKQPQVVQILPTDMAFKTNGCQLWQITDAAPPAGLPPLIGWAKLQALINEVNGRAAQSGAAQPPP